MRTQIKNVTTVPPITCNRVCFFNTILDHPMKGENRNKRKKYGEKRYAKVQKRRVEYVIWPLIFQKRVMKEMVAEVKKSARAISDRNGI